MADPELSVVLPCYNEEQGIPKILECFDQFSADRNFELILVNNGSTDASAEAFQAALPSYPFARVVTIEQNQGYGHGVYTGLQEAKAEYLAWSHADLQTEPADVFRAFDQLKQKQNPELTLVKGRRLGRPASQRYFSRGMEIWALVLLRHRLTEINAQPKVFHRSLLDKITQPPFDFNFDVYVLYQALRNGWSIEEINVDFPPRPFGQSNWAATWRSKSRTILGSLRFMFWLGLGKR